MKYMFASDLHGSYHYASKMAEAYKREGADRLILLGDLLYHGPRNPLPKEYDPQRVIDLLNGMSDELLCVRGNCDAEIDQMVLDFPIMAEYMLLDVDRITLFVTHGHHINKENPPALRKQDFLMNGHFHIPAIEPLEAYTYLNPGSLSLPKEGSAHSYMAYEQGTFYIKDLDGSVLDQYSSQH